MYTLECYDKDKKRRFKYFLKPSKITTIGRKSSEIKFDNKLISRANHCSVVAGDVDVNKRDDIHVKYPLSIEATKRVKVVKPQGSSKMLDNDSTGIEDGDILYLANEAIVMTVKWQPIHFNVSSLFKSKSSFNSETLNYAEKGLKFGRGYWNDSYSYLVQPQRSVNSKVLGALTTLKPIVDRSYLESVYQSILSDNIESILPTVTPDHLPKPTSNEIFQSDEFWLISDNRLSLFSGCSFYLIIDKMSTYLDILKNCGATINSININSITPDNITSVIDNTSTNNTFILIPSDVNDRLMDESTKWSSALTKAAKEVGIKHINYNSLDKAIMEINIDRLEFVDSAQEKTQPSQSPPAHQSRSSSRPTSQAPERKSERISSRASSRAPSQQPESPQQPRKRKASAQPEAPQKKLTRRGGGVRVQRANLDDDDDEQAQTQTHRPEAIPEEEEAASPHYQSSETPHDRHHSPALPLQLPSRQQSKLRRRANTRRMQTVNIDDSDEEPFPAPKPTQQEAPRLISPAPPPTKSYIPPTPEPILKRKTARERVDEQMAAPEDPGHDFLTERMTKRKKTLLDERNAKIAAQHTRKAEQDDLMEAQRQASRVPESESGSMSMKSKSKGGGRRKADDFDDDLQLNKDAPCRALTDCIIPMKLIPLRRRDQPVQMREGDEHTPNFKKFRRKINHIYQPRVGVGLPERAATQRLRARPRTDLTTDLSSDEDELADEYVDVNDNDEF